MSGGMMLALLLFAQTGNRPAPATFDPLGSEALRSDARLADVCFADVQHGWAVGERGTIWHTADGGRRWQLQESGVTCPLLSVCFIDPQTGWAAGGFAHPYTHTGTGVILATRDGGQHWQRIAKTPLPAIRRLRFLSDRSGWAFGCGSAMFPGGTFITNDGGQSWTPLLSGGDGASGSGWSAGDFASLYSGVLASRNGTLSVIQRGGFVAAQIGDLGLRAVTQLRLAPPNSGWLVGEGGLVMTSADRGASWQPPPGPLPDGTASLFDFAALAVRGPKIWIAGLPGTRVFHSADAGRSWTAFPTGVNTPLEAMCFLDDQRGWAVGGLGIILATEDGGRTWQRQRAGGMRAALLGLFAAADDMPLELIARLSGNEGYLSAVSVLGRRDVETTPGDEVALADRLREAVARVGGSDARAAWRFPLRQPGLKLSAEQIAAGWDRVNDGRGLSELEAHIVGQIRLWRPDVIVTHDASPRGDDPLRHLVNQIVLRAVQAAADRNSYVPQIAEAGLEPWHVKKVYAALPPPARGSTDLATDQLAPRLGRSLAELSATPRGLLDERFRVMPPVLGFHLLLSDLAQQSEHDFFSGLVLSPGSDARREASEPPPEALDLLRRIAEKRRNTQAIIQRADKDPRGGVQLLGEVGTLIAGLDNQSAGQVLFQLADRYYHTGRWDMAAETFALLAQRYPDHPLARPALLWLVQYYASGEAAWRLQGAQRYTATQTSALSIDLSQQEKRPERAAALGKEIERTRPELFAEPTLRLPLAVAARNQGLVRQGESVALLQGLAARRNAWSACARGEAWLADRKGPAPKPLLPCVLAAARPRLDGRLDDAVWQQASPAALASALHDDGDWPAAVMLAYDAEFLYVAVQCRKAPGAKYEPSPGQRPRDPDLSDHDRVDVYLDLDRDFVTYYHLAIDHRGWVADDCWGDSTWDPAWFVAAAAEDDGWTAEAAIPLKQLTGRFPTAGAVWAIGLQRTVPGAGFQSWTTPAAVTVMPEGFGYLTFQ